MILQIGSGGCYTNHDSDGCKEQIPVMVSLCLPFIDLIITLPLFQCVTRMWYFYENNLTYLS
ncbi:hypothetical protein [Pectinatus haikarae]|uniref:Uncharacterized protein n=1 Tax=Pectinatus haikarae TaxID=349096 RepID=A0ABT9YA36_9FIRM|nr:hypothetical protein [Pectinatus haikarae]MDQ0204708.1 hypothetical protein [Pectinatus haikarae]